jgi:hypothetical protein
MASKDCPIHLNLKSYLSRLFCELNFSLPGPELRLFNPRAVTSSQHAWGFLGPGSDSIHGAVPLVWHWDPACSEDLPSGQRRWRKSGSGIKQTVSGYSVEGMQLGLGHWAVLS